MQPSGSSEMQQYKVQAGDRLDSIAAEQLHDAARWVEIAMNNDIDDPLADLEVGRTLQIPK